MNLVACTRSIAIFGFLGITPSAMAIEYEARFDSLLAFSGSQYESDVTGDDSNGHTNGSYAGITLSAAQNAYRAFFTYQHGFERFNESVPNVVADDREREFFGGISGPFGTLGYGRQSSFYKQAGRDLDPFYDTSVVGFNGGFAAEGASYGLSNLTNAFNDETVAYASPSFDGLSIRASYFMDAAGDADEDYGLGLRFAPEDAPFTAGVEYLDSDGGDAVFGVGKRIPFDAIRVYGSYRWESLALGASFEQVDVQNEADERKYMLVSATYKLMNKVALAGTFGLLKDVVPNAAANPDGIDGEGLTVGAFYEVMPRFTTYVAARGVRLDSDADSETYAIGLSYYLEFDLYPGFGMKP
jgi:predicted porin